MNPVVLLGMDRKAIGYLYIHSEGRMGKVRTVPRVVFGLQYFVTIKEFFGIEFAMRQANVVKHRLVVTVALLSEYLCLVLPESDQIVVFPLSARDFVVTSHSDTSWSNSGYRQIIKCALTCSKEGSRKLTHIRGESQSWGCEWDVLFQCRAVSGVPRKCSISTQEQKCGPADESPRSTNHYDKCPSDNIELISPIRS
jgi:hypothetical protein